ncbi:putative zinc ion binding protein [Escherichia coli]|uniref:Putative zinc ion binding protein n=1 Tax=Escherichia coli TaxID=562 RepID=A0A377DKN3_ECOLX|nr:putative zinc ion binding protein [Escherichia coli]
MASGWANDDAVNEQINSTIEDAIARVGVKFRVVKACMNVKSAAHLSHRPVGKPFLACAYAFIVSRRKIYKNQLIQDIIAEVRKTASYVNYNWRDV